MNRRILIHTLYFLPVILLLFVSCKINNESPPEETEEMSGPVTFTVSPIDYTAINRATPLGNLNPPAGHVFPTNHIYFYLAGTAPIEVRAPAAGLITSTRYNSGSDDYRIEFEHTSTCKSYLDHISNLPPGIAMGAQVQAGDILGYGKTTIAVDLGVVDQDVTRTFITPSRYHDFSIHCGDPYTYFTASVRSRLLEFNGRTAEPRGGKIDYDIAGRLSGNWFLSGTPLNSEASGYNYRANQLAFVYDMIDPSIIRISCGGTLSLSPFNFAVEGNFPDPRDVSPSSGLIKYRLYQPSPATMLLQMLNDTTIRVEVFSGKLPSQVAMFSSQSRTYIR